MKIFVKILSVSILLICSFALNAQSYKFPFPQEGWVSDTEGLFTIQERTELNKIISEFQEKTNNEIAVITLNSIGPYNNIGEFSLDLSNNWSLYNIDADNSLIILVSKSMGTVRITTAYGTEKLLRNEVCRKIIDSQMLPAYAQGNYYDGTKQGVISLMKEWN